MDAGCREGEPDTTLDGVVGPMRFVPADGIRGPVTPWPPGDSLDDHHADVSLSTLGEQSVYIGPVGGVSPDRREHGEHDGVQVIAADRLEMGDGGAQVVAGDAYESGQAPVACLEDDLECFVTLVQDLQRGDSVGLVEVQFVHLESFEAPVKAPQGPVTFGFGCLACQEEALAYCFHVWPHGPLRCSVSGGDVEVVDAGVESLVQECLSLFRGVHGERRTTQDGDAGIMVGSA